MLISSNIDYYKLFCKFISLHLLVSLFHYEIYLQQQIMVLINSVIKGIIKIHLKYPKTIIIIIQYFISSYQLNNIFHLFLLSKFKIIRTFY